jgi:hypothetical protein
VKDLEARARLLEEAKGGLSLRELKARVREVLVKEKAPPPWHKEVASRLARLDPESLPPGEAAGGGAVPEGPPRAVGLKAPELFGGKTRLPRYPGGLL